MSLQRPAGLWLNPAHVVGCVGAPRVPALPPSPANHVLPAVPRGGRTPAPSILAGPLTFRSPGLFSTGTLSLLPQSPRSYLVKARLWGGADSWRHRRGAGVFRAGAQMIHPRPRHRKSAPQEAPPSSRETPGRGRRALLPKSARPGLRPGPQTVLGTLRIKVACHPGVGPSHGSPIGRDEHRDCRAHALPWWGGG